MCRQHSLILCALISAAQKNEAQPDRASKNIIQRLTRLFNSSTRGTSNFETTFHPEDVMKPYERNNVSTLHVFAFFNKSILEAIFFKTRHALLECSNCYSKERRKL